MQRTTRRVRGRWTGDGGARVRRGEANEKGFSDRSRGDGEPAGRRLQRAHCWETQMRAMEGGRVRADSATLAMAERMGERMWR